MQENGSVTEFGSFTQTTEVERVGDAMSTGDRDFISDVQTDPRDQSQHDQSQHDRLDEREQETTEAIDPVDAVGVNSETLRRAIAYIHEHAHEEVTATSIARAACVTTRAVQLAFRRYLDTTPSAYLRQVRLDHAHRDLISASKSSDGTVTQIASRWGFNHQGRFAAYYRQMYGQNPRQTLAR